MSAPSTRVLFVCLGNICRSPTAEAVFQQRIQSSGWSALLEADSAGTAGWHIGKAPDARTVAAAASRGYDLSHLRARQLTWQDLDAFDYVLGMDADNLRDIRALAQQTEQALGRAPRAQLQLLMDYAADLPDSVPDPYYGGADGFEQVLDYVESATDGLLRHLLKQRGVFGCAC